MDQKTLSDRLSGPTRDQDQDRLKEDQARADIEWLLKQPSFRRWFHANVVVPGKLMQSVMTGNSNTYYLAGKQDLAREIWSALAAVDREKATRLVLMED